MEQPIKPKISVVMPFYNAADFLVQSVESILNQTFSEFELILINDCSTDNSDEIIEKYLSDQRVVYIKNNQPGDCQKFELWNQLG